MSRVNDPAAPVVPARVTRVCNVRYVEFLWEYPVYPVVLPGRLDADQAFLLQVCVFLAVDTLERECGDDSPDNLTSLEYMELFRTMADLGCDVDAFFGDLADRYLAGVEPFFQWDAADLAAGVRRLRACEGVELPEQVHLAAAAIVAEVKRLYIPARDSREARIAAASADTAFMSRLLALADDLCEQFGPFGYSEAEALLVALKVKSAADLDRFDLDPQCRYRLKGLFGGDGGFNATLWRCPRCGKTIFDAPGPYAGVPRGESTGECPHCGAAVVLRRSQVSKVEQISDFI